MRRKFRRKPTDGALPSIVSEIKNSDVLTTPPRQLSTISAIIQNEEVSDVLTTPP